MRNFRQVLNSRRPELILDRLISFAFTRTLQTGLNSHQTEVTTLCFNQLFCFHKSIPGCSLGLVFINRNSSAIEHRRSSPMLKTPYNIQFSQIIIVISYLFMRQIPLAQVNPTCLQLLNKDSFYKQNWF